MADAAEEFLSLFRWAGVAEAGAPAAARGAVEDLVVVVAGSAALVVAEDFLGVEGARHGDFSLRYIIRLFADYADECESLLKQSPMLMRYARSRPYVFVKKRSDRISRSATVWRLASVASAHIRVIREQSNDARINRIFEWP